MRTSLIYLVFGVAWILCSDAIGLSLSRDPESITSFQNYKGLFFVGLSTLIIFLLNKADERSRAKAAHALSESENLFRATFDLTAIGMAHISPQGHWLRVNRKLCEITGYSAPELLSGMTFQQITHEENLKTDEFLKQKLLAGEIETYSIEERYVRKDGSQIWASLSASLVLDSQGAPHYFILAIEDISERHRASQDLAALTATLDYRVWERTAQLAEANRELESFSYSVSHDLRAPIRAVNGFAQILARRHSEALDEQGRHYLNNIILASERMNLLIDDFLRYSRLGRQGVCLQAVPLESVLQTVLGDLSETIAPRKAQIEITSSLPAVRGDATLISQIFLNLLDNALKYQHPNAVPHIQISAARQGEMCAVRIADNGLGIPAEQHQKIFDVFQRLHSDEIYPGTGIGLAIVAKAATLLNGTVTLDSSIELPVESPFEVSELPKTPEPSPLRNSTPKSGSVFIVRLPLWQETADQA